MTNLLTLSPEKLRALALLKLRGLDVTPIIALAGQAVISSSNLTWPTQYFNNRTGKPFNIDHHPGAREWLDDRSHRAYLAKGGEGGGKSVIGIKRDFDYLALGNVTGILASPDLPHFKKSLWPEFKAWCPVEVVVPHQRYRLLTSWEPHDPFTLTFLNGSQLICGGMDDPEGWAGPNIHFAHLDEARRKKTADALKVLDGRVRLPLPNGDPPAFWLTTTPKKHWLFDYFGPWPKEKLEAGQVDPRAAFKRDALVITLKTINNEVAGNLWAGYTEKRAQSLNEAEKSVLQDGEWADIDDVERFLASMLFWDSCLELGLKPLDRHRPVVLAADAGIRNDCFALIGVTSHQDKSLKSQAQVAFSRVWKPQPGKSLNFDLIEEEIKTICKLLNVYLIVYDEYQLHQMMTRLKNKKIVETKVFSQQAERSKADKFLSDSITQRQISHDGSHKEIREHLDNADRKISGDDRQIRLVKREDDLKIDAAVGLSMALWAWADPKNKPKKAVRQQNYLYGETEPED